MSSASANAAPPTSLTLPRELRDIIYNLRLTEDYLDLNLGNFFVVRSLPAPAIVLTSRQCCLEFASLYLRAVREADDEARIRSDVGDLSVWSHRMLRNCDKSVGVVQLLLERVRRHIRREE